jgi:hypothetical protein
VLAALSIAPLAILTICASFASALGNGKPGGLPSAVEFFEPGWQLCVARQLSGEISSLAVWPEPDAFSQVVFVGTSPTGCVYRFYPPLTDAITPIGVGLGDRLEHGTCAISALAVRDLDHDGTMELVAETSQILPESRPRLYVWSLSEAPLLRGVARPDIASSWGHGLGFVRRTGDDSDAILSTYCGHGEVVEYRLIGSDPESGFRYETLGWRQVGQLPASGEGISTTDLDYDGQLDLCVATGFSAGRAALQVYSLTGQGMEPQPRHVVDESGRFFNVKFMVGELVSPGSMDVMAWWSTQPAGGECEVFRYRFGPDGLRQRELVARGLAASLWPIDGQMTLADMDRDGNVEAWFATVSGNLWRYDYARSPRLSCVAAVPCGIGPIAATPTALKTGQKLYIGCANHVLELKRQESGTSMTDGQPHGTW